MKKSIRPVAALLCLVFLASLLTSCRKNPSDTQSFQAVAKELGYNVYDITDQYTNAEVIRTATVAAPENRAFQIEFYILTDKENAKKLYLAQGEILDNEQGSNEKGSVENGRNYAKRVKKSAGRYAVIAYVENTILYVPPTDAENEEAIKKFLKRFNY